MAKSLLERVTVLERDLAITNTNLQTAIAIMDKMIMQIVKEVGIDLEKLNKGETLKESIMSPQERAVLHKILATLRRSHRIYYQAGCRADDQSIVAMEAMHKSMADILDGLLHPCECKCCREDT